MARYWAIIGVCLLRSAAASGFWLMQPRLSGPPAVGPLREGCAGVVAGKSHGLSGLVEHGTFGKPPAGMRESRPRSEQRSSPVPPSSGDAVALGSHTSLQRLRGWVARLLPGPVGIDRRET